MSDSFTNYNYVGNTKVSVSIKKTYANKCTLSEIFLTEILDVFEKNTCLPSPARSSVRAVEGRQRTRYDRFETEAFIMVRRTCTYIYEHQQGLSPYEV